MADDFQYDVFLSHDSADKPRVRRLAERLREAGLRVWFDEWMIKLGDDIFLAIEKGLQYSRTQVLCISKAALDSDWVKLERSTVLFRDPTNEGRRFIPLLLSDCKPPDTLRRYRYVDLRKDTDAAFDELLTACRPEAEEPTSIPQAGPTENWQSGQCGNLSVVFERKPDYPRLLFTVVNGTDTIVQVTAVRVILAACLPDDHWEAEGLISPSAALDCSLESMPTGSVKRVFGGDVVAELKPGEMQSFRLAFEAIDSINLVDLEIEFVSAAVPDPTLLVPPEVIVVHAPRSREPVTEIRTVRRERCRSLLDAHLQTGTGHHNPVDCPLWHRLLLEGIGCLCSDDLGVGICDLAEILERDQDCRSRFLASVTHAYDGNPPTALQEDPSGYLRSWIEDAETGRSVAELPSSDAPERSRPPRMSDNHQSQGNPPSGADATAEEELLSLCREGVWTTHAAYARAAVRNGWTREAIIRFEQALRHHAQALNVNLDLVIEEIQGGSPAVIQYHTEVQRWQLHIDIVRPLLCYPLFAQFQNVFLLHETTHAKQGDLLGAGSYHGLQHIYVAEHRPKLLATLGFRDWEGDFGMPPVVLTAAEKRKICSVVPENEVVRCAKEVHADATALRSGYRHVSVSEGEKTLGLRSFTKVLIEYVHEIARFVPDRDCQSEVTRHGRERLPLVARFAALADTLQKVAAGLDESDKAAFMEGLSATVREIGSIDAHTCTVAELPSEHADDALHALAERLSVYARGLDGAEQQAFESLRQLYAAHLRLCLDPKTISAVGIDRLLEALDQRSDPDLRCRAAEYLGETKSAAVLPHLTERIGDEDDEHVRRSMVNAGIEILARISPAVASDIVHKLVEGGDFIGTFKTLADLQHLAADEPAEALETIRALVPVPLFTLQCRMPLRMIARNHPDEVIFQVIQPLLRDSYWETRGFAVRFLADLGESNPKKAIPLILDGIADEKDPPINRERGHALASIAGRHPDAVIPHALQLLSQDSSSVQNAAVTALRAAARSAYETVWDGLQQRLKSGSKRERNGAILALGAIWGDRSSEGLTHIRELLGIADDENFLYVADAVAAIGRYDRASFEQALDYLLRREETVLVGIGLLALGHLVEHDPFFCLRRFREAMAILPEPTSPELQPLDSSNPKAFRFVEIAQHLGMAVSLARRTKLGVAKMLAKEMAAHSNSFVVLAAMVYADATKKYVVNDSVQMLTALSFDRHFGHVATMFLDSDADAGARRVPQGVPKLDQDDIDSIRAEYTGYRKRCQEEGWGWTNCSLGERQLPALAFHMRQLGIEFDDTGLEADLRRLEERDIDHSSMLDMDFYAYTLALGYELNYDASEADCIDRDARHEKRGFVRRKLEKAEFECLRAQVLSTFPEPAIDEYCEALQFAREERDGAAILGLVFFLREMGEDLSPGCEDVAEIGRWLESVKVGERDAVFNSLHIAEAYYRLKRVAPALPREVAAVEMTAQHRQTIYAALASMRTSCLREGRSWTGCIGAEQSLSILCFYMRALDMAYDYPQLVEDLNKIITRSDIGDDLRELKMHFFSAKLGVDSGVQKTICENVFGARKAWDRNDLDGQDRLRYHHLRSALGLPARSTGDMADIRLALEHVRAIGKGDAILTMCFQLVEMGEDVCLEEGDVSNILEAYAEKRQRGGCGLAETAYRYQALQPRR